MQKENFAYCYIEAPRKEAEVIFQNRFGHNPKRVTCTCCGEDYSISEEDTLEHATGDERGCLYVYTDTDGNDVGSVHGWYALPRERRGKGYYADESRYSDDRNYMSLSDYLCASSSDVMVIRKEDIKPDEINGTLRKQGYVWVE